MSDKVYCTNCGWSGKSSVLVDFVKCPRCKDGKHIEDEEPERDTYTSQFFDKFNWVKK